MEENEVLLRLEQLRQWYAKGILPSADTAGFIDEVLDHWAPLAERLGMAAEQREMQNLAIELGFPDDYRRISQQIAESELSCAKIFRSVVQPITSALDSLGIEFAILYRMKSVYSVWQKMRSEHKAFSDLFDLFAARIIYSPSSDLQFPDDAACHTALAGAEITHDAEKNTCWHICKAISHMYEIHPSRTKNWIDHPKPSGYQALHMTVRGADGKWFEVQIRSERMNYDAEYGVAAHWKYKQELRRLNGR